MAGSRGHELWLRIHHLQLVLAWLSCYRDVPKFFLWKHRKQYQSMAHVVWMTRALELHIWRLRFGFKYWR